VLQTKRKCSENFDFNFFFNLFRYCDILGGKLFDVLFLVHLILFTFYICGNFDTIVKKKLNLKTFYCS